MQSSVCEPLRVTQEAVDADEQQRSFHGIGKIIVERGCWVIVPKEAVGILRRNSHSNPGARYISPAAMYPDRSRALPADNGNGSSS